MHSIRTRFTLLTVSMLVIALSIATIIGAISIRNLGSRDADQMLQLMCTTGAMNLETYFDSVEHSVQTVSTLVQESFEDMTIDELDEQVERARNLFGKVAYNTNGVLTYYFRIDPGISETVKGFWYVNLDGEGFVEHEVTDITKYDVSDTSKLVWFTVAKAAGEGVWLPPYYTENLDICVISYNVPVYWNGQFVGVIGIEIDYKTLAEVVENVRLYDHGYAFIIDEHSEIIYHPKINATTLSGADLSEVPTQLSGDNEHIFYTYEGVEKVAVCRPLSNGMSLYVTVPLAEINEGWKSMIRNIFIASLIALLLVSMITMRFASQLTKPIHDLTEAAKQVGKGNYDFELEYNEDDEVGILTSTFKQLAAHTKEHITALSSQVYIDPLTSVRNKRAFGDYIQDLQDKIDSSGEQIEFAVGVFDCDDLKFINDTYGHDKGDIYLKTACHLICKVFAHSPVFRIGGDEFTVVLQNDDFLNRDELFDLFKKKRREISEAAENPWEEVHTTLGLVVYDPDFDSSVNDVSRRADQLMYENKRLRKETRKNTQQDNEGKVT